MAENMVQIVERVRRSTRNADVLAVCDAWEFQRKRIAELERPAEVKRGRPRAGEQRAKPWVALGISERTWYRRQAEQKADAT